MKFLLTSAGLTNDTVARALEDLVGNPLAETSILFVPSAANTEGEDKRWLIKNLTDLQRYTFKSIDISDIAGIPKDNWLPRFKAADVICFGGGNEMYLAELLAQKKVKELLLGELSDKVYMGISAGSMVAGEFMPQSLYPQLFPEENFGPITAVPMQMYPFCFIPHLNSSYFSQIRKEKLEELKSQFQTTIYSTDDQTAIQIDGQGIRIVGKGDSWVSVK